MKWTIDKKCSTTKYVLTEFPFFDVEICGPTFGRWRLGYMFQSHNNSFADLDEAKQYVIKELYKVLSKINLDKIKDIDDFYNNRFVSVSYSEWCGNTGDGKYICDQLWGKYHWIFGRYLNTTSTAHRYAIRYDRSMSEQDVRKHALKILKRHINRFLIQYKNEI